MPLVEMLERRRQSREHGSCVDGVHATMEKAKFIKRVPLTSSVKGGNPNLYDYSGLIPAAQPFALKDLQDIKHRKSVSAEKLARMRPRLAVVTS